MKSIVALVVLSGVSACTAGVHQPASTVAPSGMDGGVPTAALGRLVFIDGDGQLAVNDVGSGPGTPFHIAAALVMDPVLSLDGREVVMGALSSSGLGLVVLDLKSGITRAIAAPIGREVLELTWGAGGFLLERTDDAATGRSVYFAVAAGASKGRLIATTGATDEARPDPFDQATPRLVVSRCAGGLDTPDCPQELVIESAAGDTSETVASGAQYQQPQFTPDGRFLVTFERPSSAGAWHLVRREIGAGPAGSALDLGPATPEPNDAPTGLSYLSPTGGEVIAVRGGGEYGQPTPMFAVRTDGGGERQIATNFSGVVGFSTAGDVVYTVESVSGPTDTPTISAQLWLARGDRRRQLTASLQCDHLTVSPSGGAAAWRCLDGVRFLSLEDGASLLPTAPAPTSAVAWYAYDILGVDGQGNGVLVTSPSTASNLPANIREISYWAGTGPPALLGRSASFQLDGFPAGTPASYRP